MKPSPICGVLLTLMPLALSGIPLALSGCEKHAEGEVHHEAHKVVVTSPKVKDVVLKQEYVCQIHSQRHIDVCALDDGYLERVMIKEGQAVKKGDLLFQIFPVVYVAELAAKTAAVRSAQVQLEQSRKLLQQKVVANVDVALHEADLAKAKAEEQRAQAALNFANLKAPFDGIVDRLLQREGSLLKEGDTLTSLSDNSVMWVYFNVPERRYLEYMADLEQEQGRRNDARDKAVGDKAVGDKEADDKAANGGKDGDAAGKGGAGTSVAGASVDNRIDTSMTVSKEQGDADASQGGVSRKVELRLATHEMFPEIGKIGAIEANFNNETGNIPFRADFPNPKGLLRNGQTGTVVLSHILHNAVVIPQRATYEILAKRYVFIVGKDHVVRQHPIEVQHEFEDVFVVTGLAVDDRIILEGIRQVRDGDKVEYEFKPPEEVLGDMKYHAE